MNITIDLQLLEETRLMVLELLTVVQEKVYTKNVVLEKISIADRNLGRLNTIQRETIHAYERELAEWKRKAISDMEEVSAEFSRFLDSTDALLNAALKAEQQMKERKVIQPMELPAPFDTSKAEAHMQAFSDNSKLVPELLALDLHIQLARKRKWLWRIARFVFKTLNVFTTALTIGISFLAGALFELLADHFTEAIPRLLTGTIVAVICGFTINKPIEKRAEEAFWRNAGNQTLRMVKQLEMLTDQFLNILKFRSE